MSGLVDFSSLAPIVLKKRGGKWENILLLDKLLTGELRNVLTVSHASQSYHSA